MEQMLLFYYLLHAHAQWWPTLCNPMDGSPPGFSVHEILQEEYWSGLPYPPPGDLPDPGIEPTFLASPALTGRFFTTYTTWEAIYAFKTLSKCMRNIWNLTLKINVCLNISFLNIGGLLNCRIRAIFSCLPLLVSMLRLFPLTKV